MNEPRSEENRVTADTPVPRWAEADDEFTAEPEGDEFASEPEFDATRGNDARSDQAPAHVPAGAASQRMQFNPLFPEDELRGLRSHWDRVQSSFVDEPRAAVEQADSLVADIFARISAQFASERKQLEKQWDRGGEIDTEDLRQALKGYRAFFDRLLAF